MGGLLALVCYVGLFRLRPWAPRLALVISALELQLLAFMGADALSLVASRLAAYLWGAVLVLPFLPPLNQVFRQGQASRKV